MYIYCIFLVVEYECIVIYSSLNQPAVYAGRIVVDFVFGKLNGSGCGALVKNYEIHALGQV